MLISIVIPVYNTPAAGELLDRIGAVFGGRPERFEVIFVDDLSPSPETWPTLASLADRNPFVRAIQLTRSFGQHAATMCGLREAKGDFVITMDDDLEHAPEEIPQFLALRDHDIVVAQLRNRQHSVFRRGSSRIKGFFDRIVVGKPRHIQLSSYRMLSRVVVDGMLAIRTPHPFIPALMFHVSKDVTGVDVQHRKRTHGRSNYTVIKRIRLFNDLVIHNSSLVLRVVGNVGILLSAASVLLAVWVIYRRLAHSIAVMGWASLFAAQMLIGGLLLFGLGVVGEYLIRIVESSEARPSHFVRRRTGDASPSPPGDVALSHGKE